MGKKGKILVSILFLVMLAIFTGVVSAADWNVSAGVNIQAAINNASDNDTVTVNGTETILPICHPILFFKEDL